MRVGLHEGRALLVVHLPEFREGLPVRVKVLLRRQGKAGGLQQPHHLFGDRRGGGQARGFDARRVDKAGRSFCRADDEVVAVRAGAQSGEGGDRHPVLDPRHRPAGELLDSCKPGGGRRGVRLVLDILGGRAGQEVAVDGRGDEDAFAHFGGRLEDGAAHQRALRLVKKLVFPPPRGDGKALVPGHPRDLVGIDPGGVDDKPRLHRLLSGTEDEILPHIPDLLDGKAGAQRGAVVHRVFDRADGQLIGADDAAGGSGKRALDLRGDIGLQRQNLLRGKQGESRHPVLLPARFELRDGIQILAGEGEDEGAVADKGDRELFCGFLHHRVAEDVVFCLVGARLRVEAGVDDGGIRLGRAHHDVLLLFEQDGRELPAGELPQSQPAGHAAADDRDIVSCHTDPSFPRKKKPQKTKGAWPFRFCDSKSPHKYDEIYRNPSVFRPDPPQFQGGSL